jgi:hypothetical protein
VITIHYTTSNGEQAATLPTTWHDLTWSRFVDLQKDYDSQIHRIAAFAGIDYSVLLANPLFLSAIIEAMRFMYDTPIEDYMDYVPNEYKDMKVDQLEWGKLEAAKQAFQTGMYQGGAAAVKAYCDIDINDQPVTKVIGLVAFFFSKLQSL